MGRQICLKMRWKIATDLFLGLRKIAKLKLLLHSTATIITKWANMTDLITQIYAKGFLYEISDA